MQRKLFIDDCRICPEDWIPIHTVQEAIEYIKEWKDEITNISLDHDAGDFVSEGGDYIKILDWLEEQKQANDETFMDNWKFSLHTSNPVGYKNMWRILKRNGWEEITPPDEIMDVYEP